MLPLATLWRIARRDLATRIRGLRLLAVCLFLGVATLAPDKLGPVIAEPHASWMERIEVEWRRRYASGN